MRKKVQFEDDALKLAAAGGSLQKMISEQETIEQKIQMGQRASEVRHTELEKLLEERKKKKDVTLAKLGLEDDTIKLQLAANMKKRLLAEIEK